MDGWTLKRRLQSPPVASKRHARRASRKAIAIADSPDEEWRVREYPRPTKLTCSPPSSGGEEHAATSKDAVVKPATAVRAAEAPLSLPAILAKYKPIQVRLLDESEAAWLHGDGAK